MSRADHSGMATRPLSTPVFPSASPRRWPLLKRYAVASLFRRSTKLTAKAIHLGELADYVEWLDSRLARTPPLLKSREELWDRLLPLVSERPLIVMELGVAWGYATQWWLSRLPRTDVDWHGFDTFTGLPDTYRSLPVGTFDANGEPPQLDDPRVTWHVGLVEDTLRESHFARSPGQTMLVLFDMDLYAPSAFAWQQLRRHLRPGDILYFDEAYDSNERRLLNDDILPYLACSPIGATTQTLALMVKPI